jgi:photosystem II stability/assembly factor-like uncharacterized protein
VDASATWVAAAGRQARAPVEILERDSGTTALLQAVSAPSPEVIWVGGHEGVVLRSIDGGATWRRTPVQTRDTLQFRDVHGFDGDRAVILSAGPGAQSRIYRTEDGGTTWHLSWLNDEPEGFYDCLDFWDGRRGLAYGDAVGGELRILLTEDAGRSWRRVPGGRLPAAVEREGGFAASGTCVRTGVAGRGWIVTGAGAVARILTTEDFGATWSARDLPIVSGSAAGAFTVVFHDLETGVVLGGDLGTPEAPAGDVAVTDDAGRTWRLAEGPPFPGAVYGAAHIGPAAARALIAAGPGGLALYRSGGWRRLDVRSYWAVGGVASSVWAVGPEGRILEITW